MPVSPPRKKTHYGTHPLPGRSLPSHSGCCASSAIPPLAASRLCRPSSSPACLCPIPAPSLRAAMTAKSAGRQRDAAMREGLRHRFGTAASRMLALSQKAAVEVAAPSPVQGCPAPWGAAGTCILRLHPPARLCLRRQLPEEPTHFRLQQGRECPVPLALLLAPAIHPSLTFNVRKS